MGWWRSVPQWSLYFLMPLASLQTCLALFHPNTMRRRPGIVFAEWLARAKCRPWVMQATSMQVWGAVWAVAAGCDALLHGLTKQIAVFAARQGLLCIFQSRRVGASHQQTRARAESAGEEHALLLMAWQG